MCFRWPKKVRGPRVLPLGINSPMAQGVRKEIFFWNQSGGTPVSSTFDLKKSIKIHYALKVPPWSLGGQDGSWHPWNWCQNANKYILSLLWKFHSILTCITLSRLTMSSKSDFGVLDDRVILTWRMACGVSIKGILCDRHLLEPFPGL